MLSCAETVKPCLITYWQHSVTMLLNYHPCWNQCKRHFYFCSVFTHIFLDLSARLPYQQSCVRVAVFLSLLPPLISPANAQSLNSRNLFRENSLNIFITLLTALLIPAAWIPTLWCTDHSADCPTSNESLLLKVNLKKENKKVEFKLNISSILCQSPPLGNPHLFLEFSLPVFISFFHDSSSHFNTKW